MAFHGTLWDRLGLSGADNMEAFGSPDPLAEQLVVSDPGAMVGGLRMDDPRTDPAVTIAETKAPEAKPLIDAQTMKRVLSGEITLAEAAIPGRQLMKTPKVKRVSEMRGKPPVEEPSYWDKFKQGAGDYFGDEENMANLAMGLNSMRLNPDQTIGAAMGKKAESARARKGRKGSTKAIVQEILIMANQPGISTQEKARLQSLAGIASKGLVDPKEILKQAFKRDTKATNIVTNIEGKTNELFTKAGINGAEKQIEGGYAADNSLRDIATLIELGENPALQQVPDMARGFIPQGFSPAMDAYNGQLNKVAKGLRQAGEGVMTEKDFEVLLETAGAASMNIDARRLLQTSLQETAKRQLQRAAVGREYMSRQIDLKEYYDKIGKLQNKPMFTPEQEKFLNQLKAGSGYDGLTKAERQGVPKSKWDKMTLTQRETFFKLRGQ